MKVVRQSTSSFGTLDGKHVPRTGNDDRAAVGQRAASRWVISGVDPGSSLAGHGERRHGDRGQRGADLGVPGREDAVAVEEGCRRRWPSSVASRSADPVLADLGAVVPAVERRRGAGRRSPPRRCAAGPGRPRARRRAAADRTHRGQGRHQFGAVQRQVLGDEGAEREADQVRARRDLVGDTVGEVCQRDARARRRPRAVPGEVGSDHVEGPRAARRQAPTSCGRAPRRAAAPWSAWSWDVPITARSTAVPGAAGGGPERRRPARSRSRPGAARRRSAPRPSGGGSGSSRR